jgi:biopolymer transport protein ExbB
MLLSIRRFLSLIVLAAFQLSAQAAEEAPKGPAWWNNNWASRKKITLNTGSDGVALTEAPGTATILVRLHDGNFNFMAAAEDGSDLRFLADDQKTVLPHHVEKWDGLLNEGYVWVKVPDLKSGAKTDIWMYYTTATPQPKEDTAKENFDADTKAVYHFAEVGSNADATPSGAGLEGVGAAVSSSLAGAGMRLNGQTPFTVPGNTALAWTANGTMTISLWVKPAALQTKAALLSRKEGAGSFLLQLDQGVPTLTVGGQSSPAGAPLAAGTWNHIVVTAAPGMMSLSVNGLPYGSLAAPLPALTSALIVGKDDAAGSTGFAGELDELQFHAVTRNLSWIKLLAANQGTTPDAAKILTIGEEEIAHVEHEGVIMEHVNLLKDIAKDLTIDGWAVIWACGILAVVGMSIAVGKFLYLNKISKASSAFMELWHKVAGDLTVLEDEDNVKSLGGVVTGKKKMKLMHQSPLYNIYHIGCMEVQKRMQTNQGDEPKPVVQKSRPGLSGRSIQAIKATLHGGLVREVQKLNGKLVFLTISIAGGPYLGLLGTVIGVMITFAVIAKSGQVEVNSIAPGIAGALLATVAGLAVAIPALFAYSYLASRIKDVVTDMETFIDEFIAKMAEHYKE